MSTEENSSNTLISNRNSKSNINNNTNNITKENYPENNNHNIPKIPNTPNTTDTNLPLLDQLIQQGGYFSTPILKIIMLTILGTNIDGLYLTLVSNMFITIRELFHVNYFQLMITSSLIFISIALGALSIGIFLRYLTRRTLWLISTFNICIWHLVLSLSSNFTIFCISRFIISFLLGVSTPIIIVTCLEYLPIQNRGLIITSLNFGNCTGQIFTLIAMLYFMPNYEPFGYTKVLLLSWIIPLVTLILFYFCFEDSPRNLILNNKYEEAFDILERICGRSITEEEKRTIIKDTTEGVNKNIKANYSELFNLKYLKNTIIFGLMCIVSGFLYYGPMLIINPTLEKLNIFKSNYDIIILMISISVVANLGNFIGGILVEVKSLGRKNTIILFLVLSLVITGLICISLNAFIYLACLNGLCIIVILRVTQTFSNEFYPTKIRQIFYGLFLCCMRIGTIISQFSILVLFNMDIRYPYILTACVICFGFILSFMLPSDTYLKPLDSNEEQTSGNNDVVVNKNEKGLNVMYVNVNENENLKGSYSNFNKYNSNNSSNNSTLNNSLKVDEENSCLIGYNRIVNQY